jgi:hypothetical protein
MNVLAVRADGGVDGAAPAARLGLDFPARFFFFRFRNLSRRKRCVVKLLGAILWSLFSGIFANFRKNIRSS